MNCLHLKEDTLQHNSRRRRAVGLSALALGFALLVAFVGLSWLATQILNRRIDVQYERTDRAGLCADSAMEFALNATIWMEAPRWDQIGDDTTGPMSPDWFQQTQGTVLAIDDCEARVVAALDDNWPPDYATNPGRIFEPVVLTAVSHLQDYRTGIRQAVRPNVHPGLRYAIFAEREIRLSSSTRLTDPRLMQYPLRTNGHFTADPRAAVDSAGAVLNIFDANEAILERPAGYDFRVQPVNFAPLRGESDPDTDLEQAADSRWRDRFVQSTTWIDYPDLTEVGELIDGNAVEDLETLCDGNQINCTLRYYRPADLQASMTVLTRMNLVGVFKLDAKGGWVLLRSMRITGTLIIYNLGDTHPGDAWIAWGVKAPLTIDKDCVLQPGEPGMYSNLEGITTLPTLIIMNDPTPDDDLEVYVDLTRRNLCMNYNDRSCPVEWVDPAPDPSGQIHYPPMMISYNSANILQAPVKHWESGIGGIVLTNNADVRLDNTNNSIVPMTFSGSLICRKAELGRVRISYPDPQPVGIDDRIPALAGPGVKTVPHSWRRLSHDELDEVEAFLAGP